MVFKTRDGEPAGKAAARTIRNEIGALRAIHRQQKLWLAGRSARGARAGVSARHTARKIDFSDMPEASAAQLRSIRRVGRPPLGETARQLIAIRLDAKVLARFRKEARRCGVGYQTLINEVLAEHVRKNAA